MSAPGEEQRQMIKRVQSTFAEPKGDDRLCLLSLDGGGVRGLSTLYILRKIMVKVNAERQKKGKEAAKPCEVFDLIGGTSTGGIIAILLGRLELGVDECITLYKSLMSAVFGQKEHFLQVKLRNGKLQNVFSQEPLRNAIFEVLRSKGIPQDQLYDDGAERTCRTFVVARRMESKNAVTIRDYTDPGSTNDDKLTIAEAVLATSAASTIFPPLEANGKRYVDGGLGTNNPTPQVWQRAQDIWANSDGQILPKLNCFISIGTGKVAFSGISTSAWGFLAKTLKELVTETEDTETNFAEANRFLIPFEGERRYYRFNVESGLEDVALQEHTKVDLIEVATNEYLDRSQQRKFELDRCSLRVASKQLEERQSISLQLLKTPVFITDNTELECNECIRTLLYPDIQSRSAEVAWFRRGEQNVKKPQPGSLNWLWDSDSPLGEWTEADSGTFWIRGMEGSGKSVAMKHFSVEYNRLKETEFVIGFFFNNLGVHFEHSIEGLLRVVLARMLRNYPALFTCISEHYKDILDFIPHPLDKETMHADWTRGTLEQAMELILNNTQYEARFVLFVDAINECTDSNPAELIQIFRGYSASRTGIKIKICFSCTTDIALEGKLARTLPNLIMQDETEEDLSLYVRACFLEGLSSPHFDSSDLAEILSFVLEKAEGCWLWVEYAVSIVNKKSSTLGDIKRELKKLPKKMEGLYEVFLGNVDREHAEEANDILAVVLALAVSCNGLHISLDDFRYLLGFSSHDQCESQILLEAHDDFMRNNSILRSRIQEHFRRLIVVQDSEDNPLDVFSEDEVFPNKNGQVRLYHSTVKDFLLCRKTAGQSLILSGPDLERRGLETLSKGCLRFSQCREMARLTADLDKYGLSYFTKFEEADVVFRRLPLLSFTLDCFLDVSCYAIQYNTENAAVLKSFWTPQYFESWISTSNTAMQQIAWRPNVTLTAACIETDCDVFIRHQIECQGVDPNEIIPGIGTYLLMASFLGATKTVALLLSYDSVNINYCSALGTPLSLAASRGYKSIVQALLDKGADPDISCGARSDPLAAAASSLNFDIVRLLWEHPNSSLCFRHSKFRSSRALLRIGGAIRYAFLVGDVDLSDLSSERGEATDVIQILALNGLDASIFSHTSIPVFLWSLSVGSTDIMRLLLENPDFILSRGRGGQSLMHIVCSAGTLNMVKLIEKRFEDLGHPIDEPDGRECTILHYGAINNEPSIIEYLLDHRDLQLDVNARDIFGLTPLHSAFASGHPKAVQALLSAGAKIDEEGPQGLSMLHFAASNLRESKVISFLTVTAGKSLDEWDRSPLHIAAQFSDVYAVGWLLDKGFCPSEIDGRGRNALHCACQNQAPTATGVIRLLLTHDVSPTAVDYGGSTPLHLAFHDPEQVSDGLFWTDFTKNYWDVFSEAECSRKATCMLGIDGKEEFVDVQDNYGNTPLHLACSRGLAAIVFELMASSVNMDKKDERGCLAFELIENDLLRQSVDILDKGLRLVKRLESKSYSE